MSFEHISCLLLLLECIAALGISARLGLLFVTNVLWSVCLCVLDMLVSPAEESERIETPFEIWTLVD